MAKSFQCADAGVICGAKVTGATEEDVLAKAVEHARQAHGVDLTQSTTLAGYARSLIKDEGGSDGYLGLRFDPGELERSGHLRVTEVMPEGLCVLEAAGLVAGCA